MAALQSSSADHQAENRRLKRELARRTQERDILKRATAHFGKDAWKDSSKVFGYRKLHDDLVGQGEVSCPNRIARLARLAGIRAGIGYKRKLGKYGGKPSVVVDTTQDRQFDVAGPDPAWISDITYICPSSGFLEPNAA